MPANAIQYSARDLCNQALRKIGAIRFGEDAPADLFAETLDTLNLMLKSWQNHRLQIWPTATQTVPLVAGKREYILDPRRPLEICNIQIVRCGRETPMWEMTRDEYDTLPVKDSCGTPTTFYYDRQREDALLYIWPVPTAVDVGDQLIITYIRELEDAQDGVPPDVPKEWWETVVYNLADRMADTLEINHPSVKLRAETLFMQAEAFDREGSVYWGSGIG